MIDTTQRYEITGRLATLKAAFDELLGRIVEKRDRLQGLTDTELLALAAWTAEDDFPAIQAECDRRAGHYGEQARRFAEFGDQLALIADLPDDTPWPQARAVIAERLKRS